jgi:hypothetical protein
VPGFCVANFWHRQQRVGTNRVGQDPFVHARLISALWRRRFGFGVSERLGRREQNHLLQKYRSGVLHTDAKSQVQAVTYPHDTGISTHMCAYYICQSVLSPRTTYFTVMTLDMPSAK